jgi:hypothetical protein
VIGSDTAAALVAQVAFWIILAIGVTFGELRTRWAAVFVLLWVCGVFGLPRAADIGATLVTSYLAVLDIVLALFVFKGDVHLS